MFTKLPGARQDNHTHTHTQLEPSKRREDRNLSDVSIKPQMQNANAVAPTPKRSESQNLNVNKPFKVRLILIRLSLLLPHEVHNAHPTAAGTLLVESTLSSSPILVHPGTCNRKLKPANPGPKILCLDPTEHITRTPKPSTANTKPSALNPTGQTRPKPLVAGKLLLPWAVFGHKALGR